MNRRLTLAIVLTVLVVLAIGALGYGAFQAGYQQGLAAEAEQVVVRDGPGWGYGYRGFGFFPGVFGLLFLFLVFGLLARAFFWRPWRWGPGAPHHWKGDLPGPAEERLSEWHRRAHGEESSSDRRQ
jgi:hypothetical protein